MDRSNDDEDGDTIEDIADISFMGYSDNIRGMLEDDISRYKLEVTI